MASRRRVDLNESVVTTFDVVVNLSPILRDVPVMADVVHERLTRHFINDFDYAQQTHHTVRRVLAHQIIGHAVVSMHVIARITAEVMADVEEDDIAVVTGDWKPFMGNTNAAMRLLAGEDAESSVCYTTNIGSVKVVVVSGVREAVAGTVEMIVKSVRRIADITVIIGKRV